jgi:Cu-Zn family superoxide dismutase
MIRAGSHSSRYNMRFCFALTLVATTMVACSHPAPTPAPRPAASPPPTTPARQAPPPAPPPSLSATAVLRDLAGRRVGTVTLTESYAGLIIAGNITGLGLGAHAIHLHEVGKCEPPFTSAGGHFNPQGKHHGFLSPQGWHLGDLPNIDTPPAGKLKFDVVAPGVMLKGANALLDADGASIVIHSSRDNYFADPSGDSGGRIACGVIVLK